MLESINNHPRIYYVVEWLPVSCNLYSIHPPRVEELLRPSIS